ncbi:AfsA-related hotdog domain-containing protein [Methylobacter tundripaludum]|uniref:AfsA-related hotdog domain-containing protein n=1 Tax=Methylobacter tundripaludum TaxID=173365 RepID=UPI00048568CD|nr:AfsA-related hotdog domain-containing protein [Methylobacter tundripaludum]
MSKKMILVGDQFKEFANEESVLTLTHFRSAYQQDKNINSRIVVGQGLSHDEVNHWRNSGLNVEAPSNPASLKVTHKHHLDHVMISEPKKGEAFNYQMDLMLNDETDRLLDHITSLHVSGMVLIEAARQASIACTEIEYDFLNREKPSGYTWTNMNVRFSQFIFPVPTRIELEIVERENNEKRFTLSSKVNFIQGDNAVCDMEMMFDVLPLKLINQIERRSSAKIIRNLTLTD